MFLKKIHLVNTFCFLSAKPYFRGVARVKKYRIAISTRPQKRNNAFSKRITSETNRPYFRTCGPCQPPIKSFAYFATFPGSKTKNLHTFIVLVMSCMHVSVLYRCYCDTELKSLQGKVLRKKGLQHLLNYIEKAW